MRRHFQSRCVYLCDMLQSPGESRSNVGLHCVCMIKINLCSCWAYMKQRRLLGSDHALALPLSRALFCGERMVQEHDNLVFMGQVETLWRNVAMNKRNIVPVLDFLVAHGYADSNAHPGQVHPCRI